LEKKFEYCFFTKNILLGENDHFHPKKTLFAGSKNYFAVFLEKNLMARIFPKSAFSFSLKTQNLVRGQNPKIHESYKSSQTALCLTKLKT
jgi:hypothetical protein